MYPNTYCRLSKDKSPPDCDRYQKGLMNSSTEHSAEKACLSSIQYNHVSHATFDSPYALILSLAPNFQTRRIVKTRPDARSMTPPNTHVEVQSWSGPSIAPLPGPPTSIPRATSAKPMPILVPILDLSGVRAMYTTVGSAMKMPEKKPKKMAISM